MAEAKKTVAAKKSAAKKPVEKKKEAAKKAVKTVAAVKTAKTVKKAATAKAAKTAVKKAVAKKLDNIVFEFDGVQISLKDIEKKAANLGGTVYVVISEKKIYDTDGNSVDLV